MTKTERLLREIRLRGSMTHGEIVQFVLDLKFGFGNVKTNEVDSGYWNAQLYGTRDRTGVLEKFCTQDWKTGRYKVNRNIQAPFTTKRSNQDDRYY